MYIMILLSAPLITSLLHVANHASDGYVFPESGKQGRMSAIPSITDYLECRTTLTLLYMAKEVGTLENEEFKLRTAPQSTLAAAPPRWIRRV